MLWGLVNIHTLIAGYSKDLKCSLYADVSYKPG